MSEWPLIGRSSEIAAIVDGLRRGVGHVVVGEAGIGKSVLVGEVRRLLDRQNWRTHLVLCSGRSDFPLSDLTGDREQASGRDRRVVIVDDAHLLDPDSADALWQLAGQSDVRVLATVRSDERAPDRVARLWTGGLCERLDLAPLDEGDVRSLLDMVLGGDVEDRLPLLLTSRAAGNALLLRELVRFGVSSGAIVRSQQVWRLAGELPVGAGAADMIRSNLVTLTPAEVGAAQLLAVGEPLSLRVAESVIGAPLMEALEDKRMATVADSTHGTVLTLGHPLYGEVLRADIAPLRLRRLRRELIAGFAQAGSPSPQDALRSVVWRLDIGDTLSGSELIAAAGLARAVSLSTAERLARAAVEVSNSVEAVLLLAEILIVEGRVAEADALLTDLDMDALSADERHAVTYSWAMARTRQGELGTVIATITGAVVDQAAPSLQVQAIYGQVLMLDGRLDEATTVVRALIEDRDADPITRTTAACTIVAGGAFAGKANECERIMRESLPAAEAALTVMPFGVGTLMVAAAIALAGAGRLDDGEKIGNQIYDRALAEDDEWLRPRGASALGVAALQRGQVRTATRYFRITVASLNSLDGQYLRYNLSYLARGAALAGFGEEARQALDSGTDGPDFPMFHADWLMAEAAIHAAAGAFDLATERALSAARYAASLGQWAAMGAAAHHAARYCAAPEAVALSAAAAERVDGPLAACVADYARARGGEDPLSLAAVSLQFEKLGTVLFAAEAAYAAAQAYRGAGDARAAARTSIRAAALHARCENAAIPWASGFQTGDLLTPREQQIALLAAAGKPDATIAIEAHISIRTVQNHLARVYRKLAITSRHDLADALPHTPPN